MKTSLKVPFLSLAINDDLKRQKLLDRIDSVLRRGILIDGPEIVELEEKLRIITGRQHALVCSSGTGALYLGYRSLPIPPKSEILMPALSWISTAQSCIMAGHIPKFVDCNENYQMDVKQLAGQITEKTKAIVVVNLCGMMSDIDNILQLCEKHNLYLIEDGSQSFGNRIGMLISGGIGTVSCSSLGAMKAFSGICEGGVVTTNVEEIDRLIRKLRYVGMENKNNSAHISLNFRMDTVNAGCLLEEIDCVEEISDARISLANLYYEKLCNIANYIPKPVITEIPYNFPCRFEKDRELEQFLLKKEIEVKRFSSHYMPGHDSIVDYCSRHNLILPVFSCEKLISETLLLPFHQCITVEQADYVCDSIFDFFKNQ